VAKSKEMTITGWLRDHWDEFENSPDRRAACLKAFRSAKIRVTEKSVCDAHGRLSRKGRVTSALSDAPEDDLIPADQIFSKIDIPARVRDFLKSVVRGCFIRDDRLRGRLNVSQAEWRNIRNLDEFKDNIFTFLDSTKNNSKVTVWGNKETVRRARATVSLGRYEA